MSPYYMFIDLKGLISNPKIHFERLESQNNQRRYREGCQFTIKFDMVR